MISSCEEEGPAVILDEAETLSDTTYITSTIPSAQDKVVLMEELTGVRCPNCPDGHQEVESILANNPGRVLAVAVHTPFLGQPFPGEASLITQAGIDMESTFGGYDGKPASLIDRVSYPGEQYRFLGLPQWVIRVNERMMETSPVNIEVSSTLLSNGNSGVISASIIYTDAASDHRFGIMLTENEVATTQIVGSVEEEDYEQEHVLRRYITPVSGQGLDASLDAGRVFEKDFAFDLEEGWNSDNKEVIVWVSDANGIVHAAKSKLGE
ncbi:MAG: Omp28-related outer membrane protein [Bacteroidota bacterium]|nr:Omp28-related outer membrane protein [Bacteroidota bacterium]